MLFCPGDAIAINMPMTVEAVVIYLGVIYAGCAAVSIADSFAPSEISTRLQIAHTKAIFVQDVILRGGKAHPLYQRVIKAQGPLAIVLPALPGKDLQVCCAVLRHCVLCHAVLCSAMLPVLPDSTVILDMGQYQLCWLIALLTLLLGRLVLTLATSGTDQNHSQNQRLIGAQDDFQSAWCICRCSSEKET